jgi:hypothetical protein
MDTRSVFDFLNKNDRVRFLEMDAIFVNPSVSSSASTFTSETYGNLKIKATFDNVAKYDVLILKVKKGEYGKLLGNDPGYPVKDVWIWLDKYETLAKHTIPQKPSQVEPEKLWHFILEKTSVARETPPKDALWQLCNILAVAKINNPGFDTLIPSIVRVLRDIGYRYSEVLAKRPSDGLAYITALLKNANMPGDVRRVPGWLCSAIHGLRDAIGNDETASNLETVVKHVSTANGGSMDGSNMISEFYMSLYEKPLRIAPTDADEIDDVMTSAIIDYRRLCSENKELKNMGEITFVRRTIRSATWKAPNQGDYIRWFQERHTNTEAIARFMQDYGFVMDFKRKFAKNVFD